MFWGREKSRTRHVPSKSSRSMRNSKSFVTLLFVVSIFVSSSAGEAFARSGVVTFDRERPKAEQLSLEVGLFSGSELDRAHVGVQYALLAAEYATAYQQQQQTSSRGRSLEVAGWVLTGIGGALLIPGIALLAVAGSESDTECDDPDRCDTGTSGIGTGITVLVGGVLLGLGVVLLAAGIPMGVVGHRRQRQTTSHGTGVRPASSVRVTLTPSVGHQCGGLSASLVF